MQTSSHRKNKLLLCIILLFFFIIGELSSTPELSLFSGNRCTKCHLNFQGGGNRGDFGKQFGKEFVIFKPHETLRDLLYNLFTKEKFSAIDTILLYGFDFRMQSARSHKTAEAKRRYFPMQAAVYLSVAPFSGIQFHYEYNFGPRVFYGQKSISAYTIIKPNIKYPTIKAGFFQPSIGIKNCDMTSLDRRFVGYDGTESLIPPNYAEFGIESIYEGLDWLTVQGGLFKSTSASEMSVLSDSLVKSSNSISHLVKFIVWPEWMDDLAPASYLGSSFFFNGDFRLLNLFGGIAINGDILISVQYIYSDKEFIRETHNFTGAISYIFFPGIILGIRGEWGLTQYSRGDEPNIKFKANQIVIYSNIIIFPFIELLPEYRFLSTEAYNSSRWALQLHLYY